MSTLQQISPVSLYMSELRRQFVKPIPELCPMSQQQISPERAGIHGPNFNPDDPNPFNHPPSPWRRPADSFNPFASLRPCELAYHWCTKHAYSSIRSILEADTATLQAQIATDDADTAFMALPLFQTAVERASDFVSQGVPAPLVHELARAMAIIAWLDTCRDLKTRKTTR